MMSYERKPGDVSEATIGKATLPTRKDIGGIPGKIAKGEVPSNVDIQQGIESTKQVLEEQKQKGVLDTHGEALAGDAKELLESIQRFLQSKNKDEKFQKFIMDSMTASKTAKDTATAVTIQTSLPAKDFQKEAGELLDNARDVALFVVRSSEFRGILIELLDIFQSFLITGTEKAISQVTEPLKKDIAKQDTSFQATTEGAKELVTEAKEKMEEGQLISEDRRRSLWTKWKSLLQKISSHPEYRTIFAKMWRLLDLMKYEADYIQKAGESALQSPSFSKLWEDAKLILEEFAGSLAVTNFITQIKVFYNIWTTDPEVTQLYHDLQTFFEDAMTHPDTLDSEELKRRGNELIDRIWNLVNSRKYKMKFGMVFDSIRILITSIQYDSSTQDLSEKFKKLGMDFFMDQKGVPDLFVLQDSITQMKHLLVPLLIKQLENVPVPKIEGSTDTMEFCIENLAFSAGELLPEKFHVKTKGDLLLNLQKLEADKLLTKIYLNADHIKPIFRNVKFHYKRKKFPKIEDWGIADVDFTTGGGVFVKINWELKQKGDKPLSAQLTHVKVSIDKMEIHIKDASKHETLDKMAVTLFAGTLKKTLAQELVNQIVAAVNPVSDQINDFFSSRPLDTLLRQANAQLKEAYDKGKTLPSLLGDRTSKLLEKGSAWKSELQTKATMEKPHEEYGYPLKRSGDPDKWTHSWFWMGPMGTAAEAPVEIAPDVTLSKDVPATSSTEMKEKLEAK